MTQDTTTPSKQFITGLDWIKVQSLRQEIAMLCVLSERLGDGKTVSIDNLQLALQRWSTDGKTISP